MKPIKNIDSVDKNNVILPETIEDKLKELILKRKYGECLVKSMDLNYRILYTDSAIDDLDKILSYLSGYKNPFILTKFKHDIDENLERVRLHPKSHPVILKRHQYEYRKLIIRHYIFVYFVDSANKEITIFRIFHELEDYQNRLGTNDY